MSGTLRDWSVGFESLDDYFDDNGVKHYRKATLDKCSVVLRGAVPDVGTLAVRRSTAGDAEARRLARLLADGRITVAQYRAGLALSQGVDEDVADLERENVEAFERMMATAQRLDELEPRRG